jgi:hypothetical protein
MAKTSFYTAQPEPQAISGAAASAVEAASAAAASAHSADAAAASAADAEAQAAAADASIVDASGFATAAAASATTASTHATNAAGSATTASGAASAASGSASTASTQATNASTSATAAAGSASAASGSATAASGSAAAASGSASAASGSASGAATSATNAASSASAAAASAASAAASTTFVQAGSNAVSRTFQNKAREAVSVTDYDTAAHAISATVSAGGGVLVYPKGSTPAPGELTVSMDAVSLDIQGPTTLGAAAVDAFGGATGVNSKRTIYYKSSGADRATGEQNSAMAIVSRPAGNNISGPQNTDTGLTISSVKQGYPTSTVAGELDGIYVYLYNCGPTGVSGSISSDISAFSGQVAGVKNTGFFAISEGVTYEMDTDGSTPVGAMDCQIGAINSIPSARTCIPFEASVSVGRMTDGLVLQATSGLVDNYIRVTNAAHERYRLDGTGRHFIYPYDDNTSANYFEFRNFGGSISCVSSAGVEFLNATPAGALSTKTFVSKADPTVGVTLSGANSAVTVATGSSAALAIVRGLVQVSEVSAAGDTGLYLCSQGIVALIGSAGGSGWVAPTTTPAAGKYCIAFDGSVYRLYNNRGGSSAFNVIQLATT